MEKEPLLLSQEKDKLKNMAEELYRKYLNPIYVRALITNNPSYVPEYLNLTGALYHSAINALRYEDNNRALRLLLTLQEYCVSILRVSGVQIDG